MMKGAVCGILFALCVASFMRSMLWTKAPEEGVRAHNHTDRVPAEWDPAQP